MLRARTLIALVASVLAIGLLVAPAAAQPKPTSYVLPGDEVFPEGIAYQQSTGYFFVSSTTDGTIFRGNVKSGDVEEFLEGDEDGRTTAIGLDVDDRSDRLFVSGGGTGKFFVYDLNDGDLVADFDNDEETTFINDVAVTPTGDAYFTDSLNPVIYRVEVDSSGDFDLDEWLDLEGTAIEYEDGFNLNGIDATPDGKYLVVVQSNTGELFRIDIETQDIVEIDLGGDTVPAGDGILLSGRTLYVSQNQFGQIAVVRLSGDLSSGTVVSEITDESFIFPTTLAEARGRLLVVNSQFNNRGEGLEPDLPFTVSSVKKH